MTDNHSLSDERQSARREREARIAAILTERFLDALYNREMVGYFGAGIDSVDYADAQREASRLLTLLREWDRVCDVPAAETDETVRSVIRIVNVRVYGE